MIRLCYVNYRKPLVVESEPLLLGEEASTVIGAQEFLRGVRSNNTCNVLLIADPGMDSEVAALLEKMHPRTGEHDAASWPVVVVAEDVNNESFRSLVQITLPASRVRAELTRCICQEAARAALCLLIMRLMAAGLTPLLRSVLLFALHRFEGVQSVSQLAKRFSVDPGTLQRHWNWEGMHAATGLSLKKFLEVVLLLKICARLSIRLKVSEAAAEYGSTEKRTIDNYRLRVGPWGDRNRGGWLKLVMTVRSWVFPLPSSA